MVDSQQASAATGTLDRTARAAVLRSVGKPFEVVEIEMEPLRPSDVRVRIAASGVCHSDLSVQEGKLPFVFPTVLGHEGAGIIIETGPAVTRVAPGDHVVLAWVPPCRACFWCLSGEGYLCEKGFSAPFDGPYATLDGVKLARGLGTATFGEQTVVPETMVVPIDETVPLDLAALVGCALATGVGAVWRTAQVRPGASVAVVGCGGVGLSIVQGARIAGASEIIAVDRLAEKESAARTSGATAFVSGADAVGAIRELTGGRGADYVFEWSVAPRPSSWRSARREGEAPAYSSVPAPPPKKSPSGPSTSSSTLRQSSAASTAPPTPTGTSRSSSISSSEACSMLSP
jgi:S-(hydroxymethyl)glutathione dehydrogenase/alcohol dehydrogenase